MNQKELKELIEFLIEKDIAEFELERGDVKVKIKRASEAVAAAAPDTRFFAVHTAPPHPPEPGVAPVAVTQPAAAVPAVARRRSPKPDCILCVRRSSAPSMSLLRPDPRRL